MDASVIPLQPRRPRRRIVRRTAAPVVDIAPYLHEQWQRQELARIGEEIADLIGEARRVKRRGRKPYPDGPGTAVALSS